VPRTGKDLAARDAALRHPEGLLGGEGRPEYTALELPDHEAVPAG
jgi:hypothetical protein